MEDNYTVVVSGSQSAKRRWQKRTYKYRRNALRRREEINNAQDVGVSHIWVVRHPSVPSRKCADV